MGSSLYLHTVFIGSYILLKYMTNRILLLFVVVVFVSCETKENKPVEKAEAAEVAKPEIKNERPLMTFTLTDGNKVDAQEINEKMVLVLFQPDCDHCQAEAKQIKARLDAFKDYQLYFISSQPIEVINQFAKDYQLSGKNNVHFGWTSVESVLNNFGAISAPSIYIYTQEGKLVESFDGQVDVEMVIRYL
jgi:thioredoxin-related protein